VIIMDDRIKHVVVLMMENRSFDHLLGYLDHPDPTYPNLDLIKPSCPENPARPDGRRVSTQASASSVLGTDPDHSHQAVMLQMFGREGTPPVGEANMSGFIASYRRQIGQGTLRPLAWWEKVGKALMDLGKRLWNLFRHDPEPILPGPDQIMRCFPPSEVPVLGFLAKQFAVLVNWHASVPGETWPNRQYAHAATSDGTANIKIRFYANDTVFQRLNEAGASWGIYHDGVPQVWAYPMLWLSGVDQFHGMDQFYADVANERLPAYSFIEPNHGFGPGEGNSQHPGNNTVKGDSFEAGEALMARIYNALVASPALFAETLFLITYDEHGGFFDHVPPRPVVNPDGKDDADTQFDFTLSGVRVPAVAVSPLIPAGTVDDTFYDHASIPATVRRRFAAQTEPLTRREEAAKSILDGRPLLPSARTDLPAYQRRDVLARSPEAATDHRLNDFQASLVELAGAVHIAREQTAGQRGLRAEALRMPEFVPDPACHAAVVEGVLRSGSAADRTVSDVVTEFTQERPGPEPVDADSGSRRG
jgi:phospholipase C